MLRHAIPALLLTCALSSAASAQSSLVLEAQPGESKPLWEVGAFLGAAHVPDYPAASQGQFRALPFPYVIYRGDILKVGDGGLVRAEADLSERLELDVGLSGSFDSDSEDNEARRGMPDLDLLLEAGPALTYHLLDKRSPLQVDLSIEARAVISAEFVDFGYEGISINPKVTIRQTDVGGTGIGLYFSGGPVWGFDGVNEYFYGVEPQFATAERPAYEAEEGYVGSRMNLGASYQISDRLRGFVGTQVGYFGGSANEDSPLFRDKWTLGIGGGLTWSFWQSDAKVRRAD